MKIHLNQLMEKEHQIEYEVQAEAFLVLRDMINKGACSFLEPIKTRLRAYRIGDIVEVEGNFQTEVKLECSRCLSEFETTLASRFALTYWQESPDDQNKLPDEDVELTPHDIGLIPFSGEEISLTEGIQEQVVLAFPLKPLCREGCKGLCSKCGAILNEGDCDCNTSAMNSSFAVLKDLKLNQ
jgi:uncharacterized protein